MVKSMLRKFMITCTLLLIFADASEAQKSNSVQFLLLTGRLDEARVALAQSTVSELEKAYLEGIILHREGNYEAAASLFRKILNARPEQVLVRRALVDSLIAMKDYRAADYQLERLIETDREKRNRPKYRSAQRRITELKPWGFLGSVAITPSSNINRGTSNAIFSTGLGDFIIDEKGKEESGIGISLSFGAYRQLQLEEGSLRINGKASGTFHEDDELDTYGVALWVDYRKRLENGFWEISPRIEESFRNRKRHVQTRGLDLTRRHRTSAKNTWTYRLRGSYSNYYEDDYLDGTYVSGAVGLRKRFSPFIYVNGNLGVAAGRPDADHLKYDKYTISTDIIRSWPNGWLGSVGIELEEREYLSNFTAVDYARHDYANTLRVSVVNRNFSIQGATPKFSCKVQERESNVAFYDYTVRECSIGFTRRF